MLAHSIYDASSLDQFLERKNEGRGIKGDMKTNWSPDWRRSKILVLANILFGNHQNVVTIFTPIFFGIYCWVFVFAFDTWINHTGSFCSRGFVDVAAVQGTNLFLIRWGGHFPWSIASLFAFFASGRLFHTVCCFEGEVTHGYWIGKLLFINIDIKWNKPCETLVDIINYF